MRIVDEQVLHRIGIAAGAAQSDDLPDVLDRGDLAAEQHGAFPGPAVRMALRRAVGLEARAMRAEPGRMAAAAGEGPVAGDAPAALGADCLRAGTHAPGQHITRATEHFARDTRFQEACRHRTAGTLVHAPGDRGIAAGDRFDALDVGRGIQLRATDRARHQQAEHALRRASRPARRAAARMQHRCAARLPSAAVPACGPARCDRSQRQRRARPS